MGKKIINCTTLTLEDKEEFFGKGFGLLNVVSFFVLDGVIYTKVIIDGNEIVLVGDPDRALHNYMLGVNNSTKH